MNSLIVFLTIGTIILLLFATTGLGQDKVITSDGIELQQGKDPNFTMCYETATFGLIRNQQFKFTVSDSWFGRDKVHHFLTSAFLSGVGYYFLHEEQKYANNFSQRGGFGFSISLGLAKEVRDGFQPQNAFSVKDLIADILGTIAGIALVSDL